ncbi:MAG: RNA polymerase subunit sigma-70 [Pirellulales bacterium]|nr:RNA polymerase subunit sigma-70 [Pirellulales bacterium]
METTKVTQWLHQLGQGDEQAAQRIWEMYFTRLVQVAKRKLEGMPLRSFDEEDVAISAMHSFCRGMQAGRFGRLEGSDDLWKLLVTITARKACAQRRRDFARKRGGGRVRGESIFIGTGDANEEDGGIAEILGNEPTPEVANLVVENCRRLLDCLDEKSRQIALWTLEGYTPVEIADKLDCARRTVDRKLERIRSEWSRLELDRL